MRIQIRSWDLVANYNAAMIEPWPKTLWDVHRRHGSQPASQHLTNGIQWAWLKKCCYLLFLYILWNIRDMREYDGPHLSVFLGIPGYSWHFRVPFGEAHSWRSTEMGLRGVSQVMGGSTSHNGGFNAKSHDLDNVGSQDFGNLHVVLWLSRLWVTLRQGGSSKTREWWWLGYDQKLPVPMEKSFEWVYLIWAANVGC